MRLVSGEGILFPCAVVVSLYGWLGSNVMAVDLYRQRSAPYSWYGACTEDKIIECTVKGASCMESDGKCICRDGHEITEGTCKACTHYKISECTAKRATCREPDGKCYCPDGLEITYGTCKEVPACTEEIERECARTGQTCEEDTGECVCKEPKMLIGGQCKEEPTCTVEMREKCAYTGHTCDEYTGTCVCEEPKKLIGDQCKEPACTQQKMKECTGRGASCKEPEGECVCEPGRQIIDGMCKEEPRCTKQKAEECAQLGATCQEPTGECVCNEWREMIDGTCKEVPTCTEEFEAKCAKIGQTCDEDTGKCVCREPKKLIGDQCKVPACTVKMQEMCARTGQTCEEDTGMCVCEEPKKLIGGQCKVPACTVEMQEMCARTGQTCEEDTGNCVCEEPKKMIGGQCKALEESTLSTTLATSLWRETTTAGTEPSKWQSGHTTEPTTTRSVTSGSPSGTEECDEQVCKPPRCHCASDAPPAGLRVDEMPQFVMLTFDGAINAANMAFYRQLLDTSRRKNKQNGCGIAATFFVSGEYLDYEAVNQLHSWGNEIALKSISHRTDSSYWQTINSTQWEREVLDQRAMLKAFANVPDSDVTGFRAPFLITGGDQGFSMLHKHFRYDSTLVHQRFRGERPSYPYTMDFGFRRNCNVGPCPEGSYPGLWELPINVLFPKHEEGDLPCAMADACLPQPVTADDTFDYLKLNFDEFYTTNRAPFPVFLHEAYLQHPERKAGYLRFVDWLLEKDDVYLVTASEVLHFMEDPKPFSAYANRTCSGQNVRGASTCQRPTTCSYKKTPPGGERYMRTCSRCPKNYPWVNNPLGN